MDMNDRTLRHIVVGMGGRLDGMPRQSGFDITAASVTRPLRPFHLLRESEVHM